MQPIWVLVADNSQASMYHFHPAQKELQLLDRIDHEEGRWHNNDFITDSSGYSAPAGAAGSITNQGLNTKDRSPKDHENSRFTQVVAQAVNSAHNRHSFESLQVCAPPRFMGQLLPRLKKDVPLSHKVTKDLVHADAAQIMSHLDPLTLG